MMGQHLGPHIFVQTSGLPQKNGNNNGDCDIPGDPEVTANIYCKSRNSFPIEIRKLQYR